MRVGWALSLALIAAAAACAAPITPPTSAGHRPSPDDAVRVEADQYARTIANVIVRVEEAYVRPVSRAALYEAALAGLYEAVREPVPAGLLAEIRLADDATVIGLLARAREQLGSHEALRGPKAILVSLQTLPRGLDPYCGLNSRREFQWLDLDDSVANTGLEFVGMPLLPAVPTLMMPGADGRIIPTDPSGAGGQASAPVGPLRVSYVQPGSPAQRAGVRPGDLITRLDGNRPESTAFAPLVQRLRPLTARTPTEPAAVTVRLTILRPGQPEPQDVTVGRSAYRPESVFGNHRNADGTWNFMLDPAGKIGYVRVGGIRQGCEEDVAAALRSLRAGGMRGLIFDLRWCPGGYLDDAASIARLFLTHGQVPIAKQRKRTARADGSWEYTEEPVRYRDLDGPYDGFPVVTLINGETSGGGELIAAALQDHGRAVTAGQRTVGKGSIQAKPEKLDIPFKVTVGTFLRPSGKNLQRFPDSKLSDDWGVRPDADRELPLTAEAGRRLKEWWVQSTLRPPGSTEALPLDDPENDPQRRAAVQMLRDLMK